MILVEPEGATARAARTASVLAFLSVHVPRLSARSALRHIPHDILQRIARLAWTEQYCATWTPPPSCVFWDCCRRCLFEGLTVNELEVAERVWRRHGSVYVELEVSNCWYGTTFTVHDVSLELICRPEREGLEDEDEESGACYHSPGVLNDEYSKRLRRGHVRAWDAAWQWDSRVRVGALVDPLNGRVTWRLNGVDGPCVPFEDDSWRREGICLSVCDFSGEDPEVSATLDTWTTLPAALRAARPT